MDNPKNKDKIIILSINGIGDAIMLTSTIRLLGEKSPGSDITVLTTLQGSRQVFETCPHIYEVILVERSFRSVTRQWKRLLTLRGKKFDVCITGFSSSFVENIIAGFIRAKHRIVHSLPSKENLGLSYYLQNIKVPMNLNDHAIRQNVRLLKPLMIFPESDDTFEPKMWLTKEDNAVSRRFLSEHGIFSEHIVIGFHPGSSEGKGMVHKRWPKEKFAALGDRIQSEYPRSKILIFGGPEEEDLKKKISDLMEKEPIIVSNTSMRETAALIKECHAFVSNDSALTHVAAAVKTKTAGIFGPTNPALTAPYGEGHLTVAKNIDCQPCFPALKLRRLGNYTLKCAYSNTCACLTELDVSEVFKAVQKLIQVR